MNLAAPFICDIFFDSLIAALPYVDFLFCNEEEALAYAIADNFNTTNLKEIAVKLCKIEKVSLFFLLCIVYSDIFKQKKLKNVQSRKFFIFLFIG